MDRDTLCKIDRGLATFLKWFTVASLVCLLILIAAGVFVRFVPVSSMGWADEIIHLGFAWIVFLGAVTLWRDGTHFRVDLIPSWLAGTKAGKVLELGLNMLSLLFFLVLAYEGFLLISRTTDRSPILDLPQILWYIIVPISAVLMLCYTIRDIINIFLRGGESNITHY
jgi:TRAP-type C4-dicarboxylate transport system permease small subunit